MSVGVNKRVFLLIKCMVRFVCTAEPWNADGMHMRVEGVDLAGWWTD